jgi:hypothetical protein
MYVLTFFKEKLPMATKEQRHLDLIIGARALALYVFDDEEKWKAIYKLRQELGLFRLRGAICGRPSTINARISAREEAANTQS